MSDDGRDRFKRQIMEVTGVDAAAAAQIEAAATEAAARNAAPDPQVDEARRAVLAITLTGKAARGWRRLIPDTSPIEGLTFGDAALFENTRTGRRIMVTVNREDDGYIWLHGSISRNDREVPTYGDLTLLHRIFMGGRLAYQLFVPPDEHYTWQARNGREILHLWAPLTGPRRTPDFRSQAGTI